MWDKVKSNKYLLYGGAIIALIGVFIILRNATGGGASSAVVTTTGPTDAQVQAQTTLALASMQYQAQANSDAAGLAVQTMQVQAGLTAAQMQAELQHYSIEQDSANTRLQVNAQTASDMRNADLQAQIAQWTLNQALEMQTSNNAFQLDYAQAANSSAVAMANIQAGLVSQQIVSNENTTIASLQSQAAQLASYLNAQTAVAISNNQSGVAINESNNASQVAIAAQNNQTARHGQSTSLIGSVIGGVLGLFSDRRLKRDIVLIGREPDGLGVYSYRYFDSAVSTFGYMADEVKRIRPWAMGAQIAGYDTVNYGAA